MMSRSLEVEEILCEWLRVGFERIRKGVWRGLGLVLGLERESKDWGVIDAAAIGGGVVVPVAYPAINTNQVMMMMILY